MAELSSKDREKLNEIVINSQINPFVSSSYENESELNRFVGREKEVELFKSILQASFDSKKAKAVRLSGPGGVGKTTLFCHIKKLLEDSSIQDDPSKRTFDMSDTIILPAYFQRPVADFNFKNIWEPLMESLIATFESKTESGINLPFYVGAKIVLQMIEFNPEILKIIYKNKEANNKRDINSVIKALNRFNEDDVKNLQEFYMDNAPEFREFVDKKFPQKQNPLSRNENSIIKELFRCFNERDSYYEDVNSGSIFEDDDQVINYLNSLVRLIMLFTGKRVLFFIGIDEFADDDKKSDTKKDFDAMGRSLLRMRNRSDSIFFTLISTDGDWANFDKSLYEKDLRSQLSSFWQIINLQNLSEKEVVDLFYKRMDHLFWRHYDGDRDLRFPAYPYNENVFKFLYKYLDKDLRETILLLKEQEWPSYKRTGKIPILETEMDCLKHFVFEKQSTPLPFMRFTNYYKEIINKFYIQHEENKSNKTRSNKVEKAFESALKAIMKDKKEISNVQHEPHVAVIGDKDKYRKPDVVVHLNKSMGTEFQRVIEFQIKVYREDGVIPLKEIESSLILLKNGYTDLIFFIITGRGLHPEAEKVVTEYEINHPGRIRRNTCSKDSQINALYYLTMFNEITNKKIEDFPVEAKRLVETIIEIDIEKLVQDAIDLPYYRVKNIREDISNDSVKDKDDKGGSTIQSRDAKDDSTSQSKEGAKTINDFLKKKGDKDELDKKTIAPPIDGDGSAGKDGQIIIDGVKDYMKPIDPSIYAEWTKDYMKFKDYFYEICMLFKYASERTGSNQNKFRINTFTSVAIKDPLFKVGDLKKLVKMLEDDDLLKYIKTSYVLTDEALKLVDKLRSVKFNHLIA